jgi:hypothetical protein
MKGKFQSGVLRRIFGPERREVTEAGDNCIMRSCIICSYSSPNRPVYYQIKGDDVRMIMSRGMKWVR